MPRVHARTPLAAAALLSIAGTATAQTLIQTPDSDGACFAAYGGGTPLTSLADFAIASEMYMAWGTTEINGPGVVEYFDGEFFLSYGFMSNDPVTFLLSGGVDFRMPNTELKSIIGVSGGPDDSIPLLIVDGSSLDVGSVNAERPNVRLVNGAQMRIRRGELRIGTAPTFAPNTDVQVRSRSVLRNEGASRFRTRFPVGELQPDADLTIDGGTFDTESMVIDVVVEGATGTEASARLVDFGSGTFRVRTDVTLDDTFAEVLLGRTSADAGLRSLVAGQTLELLGSNNVVNSATSRSTAGGLSWATSTSTCRARSTSSRASSSSAMPARWTRGCSRTSPVGRACWARTGGSRSRVPAAPSRPR